MRRGMSLAKKVAVLMGGGGVKYGPSQEIKLTTIVADTFLRSNAPTVNYGSDGGFYVGGIYRELLKFYFDWLPADAIIESAILKLYLAAEYSSNATTMSLYRTKRAWVELQATWNIYSTGNNWQTAGGFGADDCEQIAVASRAFSATETVDAFKEFPFSVSSKAALDLGNGWLIKTSLESADQYSFVSTAAGGTNAPTFVIKFKELDSATTQYTIMGDSKSYNDSTWPAQLRYNLLVTRGARYAQLTAVAQSGATVEIMAGAIAEKLAAVTTGSADHIFCNLGVNDVIAGLPAEATWKANYLTILDAMHSKWPNATMYITKPWTRGEATDCDTLAGWIDAIVAARDFAAAGDDERVWLEGGDNGVTMTTDGIHYSAAGNAAKVTQCTTLLGLA